MSRPEIPNLITWPRNLSTAQGGGMSTSSIDVYRSNIPPWPIFLLELEKRGYRGQAELIRRNIPSFLYPENFF
ncbi:hypothetical protein [Acinetobacter sp. B51(2017)]|uniref:hypothetical protein n=1 Tax=Acinetobacter sp. B51(2017) TaxID=2060938 RepID=UPI000F097CFA|nr:hypothetical protein [Acinetobacter sp. B51(2017)]